MNVIFSKFGQVPNLIDMKTKSVLYSIVAILAIIIASCCIDYGSGVDWDDYGDYGGGIYGGNSSRNLSADIINIVSDDVLDVIEGLGMPIYDGHNPPDLEGIFLEDPHELQASNRNDDQIGKVYDQYKFKMSQQNNNDLTLSLDYKSGSSVGNSTRSYISGSGKRFSVFFEVLAEKQGYQAKMVRVISGKMTDEGIKNCQIALFMVNNYGDPGDVFLDNGKGRIFSDSDNIAERQIDF